MEINTKVIKGVAKPTRFQCTICSKTFLHAKSLNEHVLTKHVDDTEKEYNCNRCEKSFVTEALLNRHIKLVHGPRIKCKVCLKPFQLQSVLAKHLRTHSINDTREHKCEFCSKSFYDKHDLQTHLLNRHNEKRKDFIYFKCELCSQEFSTRCDLEKHVVKNHVVDKHFECHVCSKKFINQETLDIHMRRHDRQTFYLCDVCSKSFSWKQSLLDHLEMKHETFFYCDKCLRSFKDKSQFDEHNSDSTQELKCYMCQEILNSECNLKIHTNSHVQKIKAEKSKTKVETGKTLMKGEPTQIKCDLCSKIFDRESYFSAHRLVAHRNADWKCNLEQCSKSFKQYSQLRLHKMEHAETKEFGCDICQKSFYHPAGLRNHRRSHTKEKIFNCELCPKSFRTAYQLTQHIGSIHDEGPKPFKCPVINCGASWSSNWKLKTHLISHQTEKLFKCEYCTEFKAFKHLGHLKRHHQEVHLSSKGIKTPKTKYADAIVFLCTSKECSFETLNHKEVANHYSKQHRLPKVLIFPNDALSSMPKQRREFESSSLIQKWFKCDVCSKYIKLRAPYGQHRRHHLNEIPFQCTHCPKSFKYKHKLKIHICMIHSKK